MKPTRYQVVWDLKAKVHLKAIYNYLKGNASQHVAEYVKNGILETTNNLTSFPERHPIDNFLSDLPEDIRTAKKWDYRISYTIHGSQVRILLVYHTALGQMLNYRIGLDEVEKDRLLYLVWLCLCSLITESKDYLF